MSKQQIRCTSNSGCDTGFCKKGTCATPGFGEPCHIDSNCSGSYVCAKNSKRCVGSDFTPNKPCSGHYDCSAEMYCTEGSCRQRGKLGDSCDTRSRLCKDGLGCFEENKRYTCHRRCHINEPGFKCPSGFDCVAGEGGYDYCQRSYINSEKPSTATNPTSRRCIKNSQCEKTGFCLSGGHCAEEGETTSKFDDPCVSTDNCSGSLVCSSKSKKCVYTDKINKPCLHQSDCSVEEYCNIAQSSCKHKLDESRPCDDDFWCKDGLFCIKDEEKNGEKVCKQKCLKGLIGFGCPDNLVCNNDLGHDGFDVCISKSIDSSGKTSNNSSLSSTSPSKKDEMNLRPYLIGAGITMGVILIIVLIVFIFIRLKSVKRSRKNEAGRE